MSLTDMLYYFLIQKKNSRSFIPAFTIVEILVVLGLFSSIATLSLGALFNAQAINGRLQETQSILDNINLSAQTITRDIRFGSDFYATTSVPTTFVPRVRKNAPYGVDGSPGGGTVLVFKSSDAVDDNDRTVLYVQNGILYKKEFPVSGATETLQMTTNDVYIKSMTFYIEGAQTSDGSKDDASATDYKQPLITLLISGSTKPAKKAVEAATFDIQTSISAREPDNR